MRRTLFIVLGAISFVLALIGVVLPLLPTVPFLMLSVFCFARGSERVAAWIEGTSLYRRKVLPIREGRGMRKKDKIVSFAIVTALLGTGFAFMGRVPWAQAVLVAVWVFHIWMFWKKIPTAPDPEPVPDGQEA